MDREARFLSCCRHLIQSLLQSKERLLWYLMGFGSDFKDRAVAGMMGWAVTVSTENKKPSLRLSSINTRRRITKIYSPSLNFTFKGVFVFAKPQITVATVETSLANNKMKISPEGNLTTTTRVKHPPISTLYHRKTSVKQYCSLK